MQRHTIVPDVITYHSAICVCKEGQQHQQALRLLRVIQCPAIVPVAITYTAAIGVCGRARHLVRLLQPFVLPHHE